jgi:hypothetical protein
LIWCRDSKAASFQQHFFRAWQRQASQNLLGIFQSEGLWQDAQFQKARVDQWVWKATKSRGRAAFNSHNAALASDNVANGSANVFVVGAFRLDWVRTLSDNLQWGEAAENAAGQFRDRFASEGKLDIGLATHRVNEFFGGDGGHGLVVSALDSEWLADGSQIAGGDQRQAADGFSRWQNWNQRLKFSRLALDQIDAIFND